MEPYCPSNSYSTDLEVGSKTLAHVSWEIRNATISKVYSLLSLQLLVTLLVCWLVYRVDTVNHWVVQHESMLIISIIGTFVAVGLMWCYGQSHPHNLIILAVFTLFESYSVAYVCLAYDATSVMLAWALTLTVTFSLSLYVHTTKQDFNFLGAGLYSSLVILIVGGLFQLLFLPNSAFLNTSMAVFGAMVACGYILYDTSELIHRVTPDQVVFSCLNLYLDVIMLFLRLLELFGNKRE